MLLVQRLHVEQEALQDITRKQHRGHNINILYVLKICLYRSMDRFRRYKQMLCFQSKLSLIWTQMMNEVCTLLYDSEPCPEWLSNTESASEYIQFGSSDATVV